jgi:nucleotide-binding universal stress UspA family protein
MIHLKTILHPTDFSEDSKYALGLACSLAQGHKARVLLLHVLPKSPPIGRDSQVPAFKEAHTSEDLETYRDEAASRLAKLREQAAGSQVETLLEEGDVSSVILRKAEETACDLIVMGTHGKSRMYRVMLGSVAADVSRKATCPVVTVRTPAPVEQRQTK